MKNPQDILMIRSDWTLEEIKELYHQPLIPLIARAQAVHAVFHEIGEVQLCTLISYKTGGCSEDCSYCAQSSRYKTPASPLPLMQREEMLEKAKRAIASGATRICIGAAWRGPRKGKAFNDLLKAVEEISSLGVEVCCTLGLLDAEQAVQLKQAGTYAYNHNLDTSREFYPQIITTRTFDDRLRTLDHVERAGISVCCGGILGLGESEEDRISLIHTLATRQRHPESVPLNFLYPIPGTPLEHAPSLPIWDLVKAIATVRITMPKAFVRLACGRAHRSTEEQALCFLAGANSIFYGEMLLTNATKNPGVNEDDLMLKFLGLKKRCPN